MDVRAEVRDATAEDAWRLSSTLRARDLAEVQLSGFSPVEAMLKSMANSSGAKVLEIDGELAAMWGVVPIDLLSGIGLAWMLTAAALERHKKTVLRAAKLELARLRSTWATIVAEVDDDFPAGCAFARWAGFERRGNWLSLGGRSFGTYFLEGAHG